MDEAAAALWRKLNLKDGPRVVVVDRYGVMGDAVRALAATRAVDAQPGADTGFFLGLATTLEEVGAFARDAQSFTADDPVVWVAYPKASSRRHRCAFNRDTGWDAFGAAGFEPVRQVAIDEDWSALRFRRVRHIKSMVRGFAMTEEGRARVAKTRAK